MCKKHQKSTPRLPHTKVTQCFNNDDSCHIHTGIAIRSHHKRFGTRRATHSIQIAPVRSATHLRTHSEWRKATHSIQIAPVQPYLGQDARPRSSSDLLMCHHCTTMVLSLKSGPQGLHGQHFLEKLAEISLWKTHPD